MPGVCTHSIRYSLWNLQHHAGASSRRKGGKPCCLHGLAGSLIPLMGAAVVVFLIRLHWILLMFWYFLFCYMTFVKFLFGFWFLKIKVGFNFVKSLWIHGYEVFLTLVLISLELLMSANLLSFWLLCFAFRRIWYPITFCLEVAYVADWKKKI